MSKDSILVIGDLMLDEWVETSFRKISLETHVPINSMMIKKIELGGAANAARVCKFISNTKVIVMGVVGDDEAGKSIKELLQRENLEDALFVDLKRQTTSKSRISTEGVPLIRIDDECCDDIDFELVTDILHKVRKLSSKISGILLSDYGKGFLTDILIREVLAIARELDIPVVADPALNRVGKFKGCNVIKPNSFEWVSFLDNRETEDLNWNEILKSPLVVITKSENGIDYYENGMLKTVPGVNVVAKDITGAGDAVAAVLVWGTVRGEKSTDLVRFANEVAAEFVKLERTELPQSKNLQRLISFIGK